MGAAAVNVSGAMALIESKTANLDVLLDDQNQSLQSFVNSAFAHLAAHQSLNISGLLLSNNIGQIFGELNELIVLGNKVGLSVDFNNNSTVSGGNSVNHAFSSDTASLLSGSSQTLFTQNLDSLIDVAISLDKSLLAFHHAAVSLAAQFHNVLCRNSHVHSSFLNLGVQTVSGGIGLIQPWRPLRQREHPAYPACLPAQHQP